jgi:hypothetical protein
MINTIQFDVMNLYRRVFSLVITKTKEDEGLYWYNNWFAKRIRDGKGELKDKNV